MQAELFQDPLTEWMCAEPEPEPPVQLVSSHVARWYQEECHEKILESLENNRSCLAVLATGTGKTQIFCAVARDWPGTVLVLVHRDELIQQAVARLEFITGEQVEIEQGQWRSGTARIVVASVQTIFRQTRLERLGVDRFSLIIVDEAHHYTARMFRKPLDFFKSAKILGVTATPDRGDEMALGKIFDEVAYVLDIADAIEDGWLVPLTGKRVHLDEINLSNVHPSKAEGGLNIGELDEEMLKAVEGICHETLRLASDRIGIGFFPGVRSAELAAYKMNELRPGSAQFVSGETDPLERRSIMDRFRKGEFQFLFNCQIATEGFDAPQTDCIIMGRPTKSRSLYAQMAGRGTRVLPGLVDHLPAKSQQPDRLARIGSSAKPDCLILDFVGNSGRHALITPEDILGGSYSSAEVERAKKLSEKSGGGDVRAMLDAAREELRRLAREHQAQVKATVETFSPFALLGITDDEIDVRFGARPVAKWLREKLDRKGVKDIDALTHRQAMQLSKKMDERQKAGLATLKQVRTLQKWGINATDCRFGDANKAIDYLVSQGWGKRQKVDPHLLNAIAFGERSPGSDE